ncbi:MAG: hypothetical protein AAFN78_10250 [Pseudomonadota bacterium]
MHTKGTLAAAIWLLGFATHANAAFINELHYDNAGGDVGEGVEIAGLAGLSLDGWSLLLYNGSNGSVYGSEMLSGVIDDEGSGYGAVYFDIAGMQNGGPDGVALVDAGGQVIQLLSYEGSFIASDGAAAGLTSIDIGVAEDSSTAAGESLQLVGAGAVPGDFTWAGPRDATPGLLNVGQSLAPVPVPAALPLLASALGLLGLRRR